MKEARQKLGILVRRLDRFEEKARALAAGRISDQQAQGCFELHLRGRRVLPLHSR